MRNPINLQLSSLELLRATLVARCISIAWLFLNSHIYHRLPPVSWRLVFRGIRAEAALKSFTTIKKKCSEQRPVLECSFAQEFTRNNASTNHKALDPAIGISVGSFVYRLVFSQPSCKRFFLLLFLLLFLFLFPSTSVFLLVYIAFKKVPTQYGNKSLNLWLERYRLFVSILLRLSQHKKYQFRPS